MRELTRLMEEMQPHVVVVPGPGIFSLGGYWLARKMGIPVCVTFQTDYTHLVQLYWGPVLARLASGLLDRLNLAMFRGASTVATISETMVEQARAIGVEHPYLVGTPLAHQFIRQPAEPPPDGVRSVLYVGRLAAEKNIDDLLALVQARPDLQFTILGDGPLREQVLEAAERLDNLTFTGWVSRAGVIEYMDAHEVLLLPSAVEAFGTVALEAMARARWVITSPACGINQWSGLAPGLLPLEEGESLQQGLRRLEQMDPATRTELAEQARRMAADVNEQTLASWEEVLRQTALRAPELPRPAPSATLGMLRRLSARTYS
jgi:glycosyltransferase involved in cell wall biosynthesis